MFRPHYQIHTQGVIGTHFEKEDVLNPFKTFLERHNVPSEIANDVSFFGNSIYIKLKKGSIDKYLYIILKIIDKTSLHSGSR